MIEASLRRPEVVHFNQAEPSIILVHSCRQRGCKVAAFPMEDLTKAGLKASGVGLGT